MFKGFDTFDFRASIVLGEPRMTMIFRHEWGVILDETYQIKHKLNISQDEAALNMHDFNFVDNGTSALMLKTITKKTTKEITRAGGIERGRCRVRFYGFEELDANDFKKTLFSWS